MPPDFVICVIEIYGLTSSPQLMCSKEHSCLLYKLLLQRTGDDYIYF